MKRVSKEELEGLRNSTLFDEKWYLEQYPDVKMLGMDPFEHYLWVGKELGRNPSAESTSQCTVVQQFSTHDPQSGIASKVGPKFSEKIKLAETAATQRDWILARALWIGILQLNTDQVLIAGRAKMNISILDRLIDIESFIDNIGKYQAAVHTARPRIAVFSANAGAYDSLKLPAFLSPHLEFVIFSDEQTPETGIWRRQTIPYHHADPTRRARYVKTHAHSLLPDFDYAVWIDGNISIIGDIMPLVQGFIESGQAIGAIPHPERTNIYDEVEACIAAEKDDASVMREQAERYRKLGFEHDDLIESNFLMYNLKHEMSRKFADTWWEEIERHSRRDQLSINYALRRHGLDWHRITSAPESARTHSSLAFGSHGRHDDGLSRLLVQAVVARIAPPTQVADQRQSQAALRSSDPTIEAEKARRRIVQFTPEKTANAYYCMLPDSLRLLGIPVQCTTNWEELTCGNDGPALVHFHQLEPLYHKASHLETWDAARSLVYRLKSLRTLGYVTIHTWHNPYPHDRKYIDVDLWIYEELNNLFDKIIVHLRSAIQFVQRFVETGKIHYIPHPSFANYYGPAIDKADARARLGLNSESLVFLSLGEIKAYKGIEQMLTSWKEFVQTNSRSSAVLLIAGRPHDDAYRTLIAQAPQVAHHLRFIPDDEIPHFLSAADVAVYNHQAIWTSGAAILAMSYGLPVIMPKSKYTEEYVEPGNNGFLFSRDDASGLSDTLEVAARSELLIHMSRVNIFTQRSLNPGRIAQELLEVYK